MVGRGSSGGRLERQLRDTPLSARRWRDPPHGPLAPVAADDEELALDGDRRDAALGR